MWRRINVDVEVEIPLQEKEIACNNSFKQKISKKLKYIIEKKIIKKTIFPRNGNEFIAGINAIQDGW